VASGDLPSPASEKARKKVPSEGQQCVPLLPLLPLPPPPLPPPLLLLQLLPRW
jgi:hypothetical protein